MAESNKIFCEPCEHDGILTEAIRWCNDCTEGFCEECIKGHRSTKILRNHHIITIAEHLETPDLNISQTCDQHSKPLDSFCTQHDELLCLKCVQLNHSNCGDLLRIEEAVKGVKTSTALADLDEQVTTLLRNIARGLELNDENKKSFCAQKKTIIASINDTRARINTKLDQLQEKLVNELETKYGKSVSDLDELENRLHEIEKRVLSLQTQLNWLKTHASDSQTFIGMKHVCSSVCSEKKDFEMKMKTIHPDLELHISSRTSSLIDNLNEFGEIVSRDKCDFSAYMEPQNTQAQLDSYRVCAITEVRLKKRQDIIIKKGPKQLWIRGCGILYSRKIVFTDYYNERLIIHKENGTYGKEIKLPNSPVNVALVQKEEVAITYKRGISHFDVIDLETSKTTTKSWTASKWNKAVCFFDGKYYVAVDAEGVREITPNGVTTKTIIQQAQNVSKIGAYDHHFFYSRPSYSTIYCCDFDGNPVWEFSNDGLFRKDHAPPFAVDSRGNVYVVSYNNSTVLGISFDGRLHAVLLTELDGLNHPTAIFCDQQNNQLLVCNERNGQAFVFDIN